MAENKSTDALLVSFMKEFFPYSDFKKAGIFTKEMRNDYEAQASCICNRLGLKSIYEYGKDEIRCHITFGNPDDKSGFDSSFRPLSVDDNGDLKPEPFVTVIPSIYE